MLTRCLHWSISSESKAYKDWIVAWQDLDQSLSTLCDTRFSHARLATMGLKLVCETRKKNSNCTFNAYSVAQCYFERKRYDAQYNGTKNNALIWLRLPIFYLVNVLHDFDVYSKEFNYLRNTLLAMSSDTEGGYERQMTIAKCCDRQLNQYGSIFLNVVQQHLRYWLTVRAEGDGWINQYQNLKNNLFYIRSDHFENNSFYGFQFAKFWWQHAPKSCETFFKSLPIPIKLCMFHSNQIAIIPDNWQAWLAWLQWWTRWWPGAWHYYERFFSNHRWHWRLFTSLNQFYSHYHKGLCPLVIHHAEQLQNTLEQATNSIQLLHHKTWPLIHYFRRCLCEKYSVFFDQQAILFFQKLANLLTQHLMDDSQTVAVLDIFKLFSLMHMCNEKLTHSKQLNAQKLSKLNQALVEWFLQKLFKALLSCGSAAECDVQACLNAMQRFIFVFKTHKHYAQIKQLCDLISDAQFSHDDAACVSVLLKSMDLSKIPCQIDQLKQQLCQAIKQRCQLSENTIKSLMSQNSHPVCHSMNFEKFNYSKQWFLDQKECVIEKRFDLDVWGDYSFHKAIKAYYSWHQYIDSKQQGTIWQSMLQRRPFVAKACLSLWIKQWCEQTLDKIKSGDFDPMYTAQARWLRLQIADQTWREQCFIYYEKFICQLHRHTWRTDCYAFLMDFDEAFAYAYAHQSLIKVCFEKDHAMSQLVHQGVPLWTIIGQQSGETVMALINQLPSLYFEKPDSLNTDFLSHLLNYPDHQICYWSNHEGSQGYQSLRMLLKMAKIFKAIQTIDMEDDGYHWVNLIQNWLNIRLEVSKALNISVDAIDLHFMNSCHKRWVAWVMAHSHEGAVLKINNLYQNLIIPIKEMQKITLVKKLIQPWIILHQYKSFISSVDQQILAQIRHENSTDFYWLNYFSIVVISLDFLKPKTKQMIKLHVHWLMTRPLSKNKTLIWQHILDGLSCHQPYVCLTRLELYQTNIKMLESSPWPVLSYEGVSSNINGNRKKYNMSINAAYFTKETLVMRSMSRIGV